MEKNNDNNECSSFTICNRISVKQIKMMPFFARKSFRFPKISFRICFCLENSFRVKFLLFGDFPSRLDQIAINWWTYRKGEEKGERVKGLNVETGMSERLI